MKPKIATFLAVGAMLALLVSNTQAATFVYACKYQDDSKLYSAKLDMTKHTLTWRGSVYSNVKNLSGHVSTDECARDCYRGTRSDGGTAVLNVATQGVADLTVSVEPNAAIDCDLVRQ
jgi:hypothetical protein